MSVCKAKNCSSDENINKDLTFHKFPLSIPLLLQKWLVNIAPPNFVPEQDDVICSLHFTDDQYLDTVPRRLTRYAVPTLLFIDNKYIPVIEETNTNITETTSIEEPSDIKNEDEESENESSKIGTDEDDSSEPSIQSEEDSDSDFEVSYTKRKTRSSTRNAKKVKKINTNGKHKIRPYSPRFIGDFKESDLKSPEKMRKLMELSFNQIEDQKRKLKTYQQKNRRLESQVTRLKNIIKHLKSVHR